jgi:hypothetical protein
LDFTVLDDAVVTHDTVTQLIAAIRRMGQKVASAAAVTAQQCTAHHYTRRETGDHLGRTAATQALVSRLVPNARRILDAWQRTRRMRQVVRPWRC